MKLELAVQLDGQFKDTNRVKRYGEDAVAWLIGVPERSISRFPWGEVVSTGSAGAIIICCLVRVVNANTIRCFPCRARE
ncbi:MAG: hypothetical protein V3T78_01585 [Dehalococcoidia bacterium]